MKINKSTVKDVLKLALPAVGEMILYMMIYVFDTMMVGKYGGSISVSSVSLGSEIMSTFSNIFISTGISVGIASLVSRRVGAGSKDLAEEYATLGFITALVISLLMSSMFFVLSRQLFRIVGAEPSVIDLGQTYMPIASIGIAFSMVMNSLNSILRGFGNTLTPLLASVIINIINISLDYILIFGKFGVPEFGVKGAAMATTTAQVIGFLFIVWYMIYKSQIKVRLKYIKHLNINMLKDLLNLSIPSSLQEGAFGISRLLSNVFIVGLGSLAFASNQITTSIESISFMPGWGFAVAATTLVGKKVGEKDYKKAEEYAFTSIFLATLIMTFCSILFLLIPNTLVSLFIKSSETQVIKDGSYCLMVAAIEQPFLAISMVVGGILKGSGNTKTPFKVSLFSSWAIRMPLMLFFIYYLKLSVVYVWVITSIQWAVDGILILCLYKKHIKAQDK